jgi:hypothetical protein
MLKLKSNSLVQIYNRLQNKVVSTRRGLLVLLFFTISKYELVYTVFYLESNLANHKRNGGGFVGVAPF